METELTCGVCWDLFDQPVLLPCGHSFCRKCINATVFNQYSEFPQFGPNTKEFNCPICQQIVKLPGQNVADELPPNRALESIVTLHIAKNPCQLNDIPWNREVDYKEDVCALHNLGMCHYCQSCDIVVCADCVTSKHSMHLVVQMKEYAVKIQAEIANGLVEVKRKCSSLEENIAMMEDVIAGINANQKQIEKQLVSEIEQLMVLMRAKQDDLRQDLHNEFQLLCKPFKSYLAKCQGVNKAVDDLKKRLFEIQQSRKTSTRIKFMQQAEKQLNTLRCFDLATQTSHKMPTVNMPKWQLCRNSIDAHIRTLKWERSDQLESSRKGRKGGFGDCQRLVTVETQTDTTPGIISSLSSLPPSTKDINRIPSQPNRNFAKYVATHASGRSSPVNSIDHITENEHGRIDTGHGDGHGRIDTENEHGHGRFDTGHGDSASNTMEPRVKSADCNDMILNIFRVADCSQFEDSFDDNASQTDSKQNCKQAWN